MARASYLLMGTKRMPINQTNQQPNKKWMVKQDWILIISIIINDDYLSIIVGPLLVIYSFIITIKSIT